MCENAKKTMGKITDTVKDTIKHYTLGEEVANSITHGIGVLLGVVAMPILLIFSVQSDIDVGYKIAASIVYCLSMILLYTASTLYHGLTNPRAKVIFKLFDHASIYLLIAGTYTPFALITLRHDNGWTIFFLLWGMALAGIVSEAIWKTRPRWFATVIYLVMGWSAVWVLPDLYRLLAPAGFWLLVAGAIAYTLGTIFYIIKKVKWFHSVFHGWVLLATFLHFFAILLFVIL
ncbi:MAG: hemolysin III family protein [Coriobacteriia bacterium]|nr:hemolysin III family protein [Coriobacteriia bacterium]